MGATCGQFWLQALRGESEAETILLLKGATIAQHKEGPSNDEIRSIIGRLLSEEDAGVPVPRRPAASTLRPPAAPAAARGARPAVDSEPVVVRETLALTQRPAIPMAAGSEIDSFQVTFRIGAELLQVVDDHAARLNLRRGQAISLVLSRALGR